MEDRVEQMSVFKALSQDRVQLRCRDLPRQGSTAFGGGLQDYRAGLRSTGGGPQHFLAGQSSTADGGRPQRFLAEQSSSIAREGGGPCRGPQGVLGSGMCEGGVVGDDTPRGESSSSSAAGESSGSAEAVYVRAEFRPMRL